ncbi:hypothetical protein HAX54_005452, partial [Datura stramonium]|nr:hypothetical protein [Datura stramonium]
QTITSTEKQFADNTTLSDLLDDQTIPIQDRSEYNSVGKEKYNDGTRSDDHICYTP